MGEKGVKRYSIHSLMLRTFLLLSAVTLGLVSVIFTVMQYRTMRDNVIRTMQGDCAALSGSIRQDMKELDRILLTCIASSELKEEFSDYLSSGSAFERNRNRQKLAGTMMSLKGFDFSVRQLNLYDTQEGGFGVGNYNGDLRGSVKDEPWEEETRLLAGRKYIETPAPDPIASASAGMDEATRYLSLSRMFYNEMHVPLGFVEVKMYYEEFFRSLSGTESGMHPSVAVYDAGGRQLYPIGEEIPYFEGWESGGGEIRNENTGEMQYLCFSRDEEDGLLIAMAVDKSEFMAPVYRSLLATALSVLVIFAVSAALAAALAGRVSDPIRQIYHFLSDTREQPKPIRMEDTGIREIDRLRDTLNEHIEARESAARAMVTLKEQEMQARMLALQSQMNPHFLYNSLSAIGEMADIGLTDQVSAMCGDITSILRYISSDREQRIRVEEEMEQVDRYLHCMKRRYGSDLEFEYRIEDDVLDCMVPKLCVQLLVENAIKSMTTRKPPWKVEVEGFQKDADWYVTVKDNGPGFDPEVDRSLRQSMDEILATEMLPSLKIEGMGILNIFIRLYLLDGIPFIFDFGNREEGGAFVTVGGHIHDPD